MTAPTVYTPTTAQTTTNGTSHAITLPAVINRGELLLMFCATDGNPTMTAPSGWTVIQAAQYNGTAVGQAIFAKSAVGTEDGTSVTWTTGASEQTSTLCYLLRGWSGTLADVQAATVTTGADAAPDPPNLNPVNYTTEDWTWFAVASADGNKSITSLPSGFAGNTLTGSSTNSASLFVGHLNETGTNKNPGAMAISGADEWVSTTVAILGTKTYLTETFEAATPAGTALSSSNTAFNTYNGSDTSVTSDTTPVPDKGLLYGQFVGTTNTRTAKSLNLLPGATNGGNAQKQLWMRFYFRITGGAPAVATRIAVMEESAAAGGTDIATIRLQTDGTLRLGDVATYPGTGTSHVFTDAHWHRIEWWVDQESDYQEIRCWWGADRDDPSTSPANGFYESINYVTTSVDAIEGFGIGLYTGGNAIELMYDDVAAGVGGWLGPTAAGATAATGTGSLTLGATVTAQAAATGTGSLTLGATALATAGPVSSIPANFAGGAWTGGNVNLFSDRVEFPGEVPNEQVNTVNTYSLVGDRFFWKVAVVPSSSTVVGGLSNGTIVAADDRAIINIGTSSTQLICEHDGGTDYNSSPSHDASKPFMSLREDSGTLYYERSATGQPGTWETMGSVATPAFLDDPLKAGFKTSAVVATTISHVNTPGAAVTATGSLSLSGTVAAKAAVTATGSLTLAATGTAKAAASATGSLTLAATATARGAATATGSLTLAGAAAWIAPPVSGSITLSATAAAKAAVTATGSLSLSGTAATKAAVTATGSLSLSGTVTSQAVTTATGSLSLSGTATSRAVVTATGSLTLGATAAAKAAGTAAGSLSLSGAAAWVIPSITGSLSLSGTATSQAVTTATGSLSLSGTAAAFGPGTAANGSIALNGSVAAAAAVTASGSLSLSGTATSRAVVTATGSLTLGATTAAKAAGSATGSLTLGATAAAKAAGSATGSLTLGATAAAKAAGSATGSLTLGATAAAKAAGSATGSLSLSGAATAAGPGTTANGSLTLDGAVTAQAAITASGSLTLNGVVTAQAAITAAGSLALSGTATATVTVSGMVLGTITLGGLVAVAAQVSAQGLITLMGSATAVSTASLRNVTVFSASVTQPHYAVTAAQREAAAGATTRRSAVAAPQNQTATEPDRRNAEAIP